MQKVQKLPQIGISAKKKVRKLKSRLIAKTACFLLQDFHKVKNFHKIISFAEITFKLPFYFCACVKKRIHCSKKEKVTPRERETKCSSMHTTYTYMTYIYLCIYIEIVCAYNS